MPTVYEIRWTEFSYALLNSVLVSWKSLVTYFQKSNDVAAAGHMNFLTSFPNLQLLVFLAYMLFVYARFQKRLQCNSTTLIDMNDAVTNVMSTVNSLKNQPLIGGWQETILQSVVDNDEGKFLNGVHLSIPVARRQRHHFYVSDRRDITAVQNEIAESLVEFLHQ